MPFKKFKVPDSLDDLIRHLHPVLKKKMRNALEIIQVNPFSGKALRDELEGLMTFRVGHLRVIYRVSTNLIEIVAIGPRKNIYAETFRLIRREKLDT